jgi:hypothetical protein
MFQYHKDFYLLRIWLFGCTETKDSGKSNHAGFRSETRSLDLSDL